MLNLTCQFCGSSFQADRKHAKFCKSTCRTLYSLSQRFTITEVELDLGSVDKEKTGQAGKEVKSMQAVKAFLRQRGILRD